MPDAGRSRRAPPTCEPSQRASAWRSAGRCCEPGTAGDGRPLLRAAGERPPGRRPAAQHLRHPDRRGSGRRRCRCGPTSTSTPPSTSSGTRRASTCASSGHTHFVTVGQAIGTPECPVPTGGLDWIPTVPPVVLEHWPARARAGPGEGAFTTVGNWRGYGSVEHDGQHYGQKAHSMREFMRSPAAPTRVLRPALGIHPDETPDLEALDRERLGAARPGRGRRHAGLLPGLHQRLAGGARGREERLRALALRVVQRSQRLLPRVRPAGPGAGDGLSALSADRRGPAGVHRRGRRGRGIEQIRSGYDRHASAARALAEEHLDSDLVLTRLLDRLGSAHEQRGREPRRRDGRDPRRAGARARATGGERRSRSAALERRPCAYRTSFALEELDVRARRRDAPAADAEGPQPGRAARRRAGRQARRCSTTRCGRSTSTGTCSPGPGSARRVLRREHRPGAGPLLALHRERGRRRAVADRRARGLGGGGAVAGADARRPRPAGPRSDGPLLRYDAGLLGVWAQRAAAFADDPGSAWSAASGSTYAGSPTRYDQVTEQLARAGAHLHPRRVLPLQRAGAARRCPAAHLPDRLGDRGRRPRACSTSPRCRSGSGPSPSARGSPPPTGPRPPRTPRRPPT